MVVVVVENGDVAVVENGDVVVDDGDDVESLGLTMTLKFRVVSPTMQ